MSENQVKQNVDGEEPKVFSIAQFPVSGGADMDRRAFLKGTVTTVGAGAVIGLLSGCEGDDEDHPFVGEKEALPGDAGTVGRGETGINIKSASGETRSMPCGSAIPSGWVCTCNCVTVPSCTCNSHVSSPCSCNSQGGSYITYWYPN